MIKKQAAMKDSEATRDLSVHEVWLALLLRVSSGFEEKIAQKLAKDMHQELEDAPIYKCLGYYDLVIFGEYGHIRRAHTELLQSTLGEQVSDFATLNFYSTSNSPEIYPQKASKIPLLVLSGIELEESLKKTDGFWGENKAVAKVAQVLEKEYTNGNIRHYAIPGSFGFDLFMLPFHHF